MARETKTFIWLTCDVAKCESGERLGYDVAPLPDGWRRLVVCQAMGKYKHLDICPKCTEIIGKEFFE